MRLHNKQKLRDFAEKHADARTWLETWEAEVEKAAWKTPLDLKAKYSKADLPGDKQALFDICGNKYRLWVSIAYNTGLVLVKEIGTHKEYDKWKII